MKKKCKISLIILILVILLITIIPIKNALATEDLDAKIYMSYTGEFKPRGTIEVKIKVYKLNTTIDSIFGKIDYDKNIFNEITEDDIQPSNGWNYPSLNIADGIFTTDSTKGITTDGDILSINFRVKEDVTATNSKIKLSLLELGGLGKDLKINTDSEKLIGEKDENSLYVSTETYKIGNNDINNYEDGDEYISKVKANTKLTDYINNLSTNGEVSVIKEDETELTEDEYVGTGMILKVTKDEEEINLKIAVEGDLSGDGKVTATDLSTINQTILKLITLENEYKIAGDLDENDEITATDLSTINQIILKLI